MPGIEDILFSRKAPTPRNRSDLMGMLMWLLSRNNPLPPEDKMAAIQQLFSLQGPEQPAPESGDYMRTAPSNGVQLPIPGSQLRSAPSGGLGQLGPIPSGPQPNIPIGTTPQPPAMQAPIDGLGHAGPVPSGPQSNMPLGPWPQPPAMQAPVGGLESLMSSSGSTPDALLQTLVQESLRQPPSFVPEATLDGGSMFSSTTNPNIYTSLMEWYGPGVQRPGRAILEDPKDLSPEEIGGVTSRSKSEYQAAPYIEAPTDVFRFPVAPLTGDQIEWPRQRLNESIEEYRARLRAFRDEFYPDEPLSSTVLRGIEGEPAAGLGEEFLEYFIRTTGLEGEPSYTPERQSVPLGEPQNEPPPPYMFERGVPETPAAENNGPSEPTTQDRVLQLIEDYVFSREGEGGGGGSAATNSALAANAENLRPNMYSDLARFGFGMASGESPFFGVNAGNAGLGMMDARQSGFADYQNALFDIEQLDISNRNSDIAAESARMSTAAELYRLTQPVATEGGAAFGGDQAELAIDMYHSRTDWIVKQLETEIDPATRRMLTEQLLAAQSEFAQLLGPELAAIVFGNNSGSVVDVPQGE